MTRSRVTILAALLCLVSVASAMKLYKKIDGENKYSQVLVPVSSTVISLDELPTFTVSSRLGPATELPPPGVTRPTKPFKLITAKPKKASGPVKKATIEQLTKEQFEQH